MKIIKAPQKYEPSKGEYCIFLAGSIEMGKAELWQERIEKNFKNYDDLVLYNPRRDDWRLDCKQSIEDEYFRNQVNWELDKLEQSDLIVLYLSPDTKSPISLLELGLFAKSNKIIVCCPDGFWRKGNVEVVCKRNNIPLVDNFDDLIKEIKKTIEEIKSN